MTGTYIALEHVDEESWDRDWGQIETHAIDVFVASDDDEYPDPIDGYTRFNSTETAYAYANLIAKGRSIEWID